jgi:hypothetical protein
MAIMKSVFGSYLYGTNIESSDKDYKFVFLPTARDLVLQKVKNHQQQNTKNSDLTKNNADDIDCEGFSLQNWFYLLSQGQTLAVEMLFTPKKMLLETSPLWKHIQNNKHKLISRKISPFVGYVRAQSSKYCIKAERMNAVEWAMNYFKSICDRGLGRSTVINYISDFEKVVLTNPHIELETKNENVNHNYLMVCGRKVVLNASARTAFEMYEYIYKDYGYRTERAAKTDSIDWKSLYHAVRIAHEANELINTGIITLPRPEAPLLLNIRNGLLSYDEVTSILEDQNDRLQENLIKTTLPEEPDYVFIEDVIYEQHIQKILGI